MNMPQKHPLILAIDTSEIYCSAALYAGDMIAKRCDSIGRGHAEHLLPMLDDLLSEADVAYSDIDSIAVGVGPGSFTGLRVGLSVARGLALTLDIPCVGVNGLMLYAHQGKLDRPLNIGDHIHSVIKGRGSQVFYQMFTCDDNEQIVAIDKAQNIEIEAVKNKIAENKGIVVGSADIVSTNSDLHYIDPVVLAQVSGSLDPKIHPPVPHYLRSADAVKKPALLPIAHFLNPTRV